MRYALLAVLIACAAPTDARLEAPNSVNELRIVHPKVVTVTVTPDTNVKLKWLIPDRVVAEQSVQFTAVARDGQGRILKASSWVWLSTDTTIATVTQTGLATSKSKGGSTFIRAIAFSPFYR